MNSADGFTLIYLYLFYFKYKLSCQAFLKRYFHECHLAWSARVCVWRRSLLLNLLLFLSFSLYCSTVVSYLRCKLVVWILTPLSWATSLFSRLSVCLSVARAIHSQLRPTYGYCSRWWWANQLVVGTTLLHRRRGGGQSVSQPVCSENISIARLKTISSSSEEPLVKVWRCQVVLKPCYIHGTVRSTIGSMSVLADNFSDNYGLILFPLNFSVCWVGWTLRTWRPAVCEA